jgi:hypothetical protein
VDGTVAISRKGEVLPFYQGKARKREVYFIPQ